MTCMYLSINTLVSEKEILCERMTDVIKLLSAPIAAILRFQEIIDKSCVCRRSEEK